MGPIPDDLALIQKEWHAAYQQLATCPRTALRRRLIHLSSEALFHPDWQGRRSAGWTALHGARHAQTASYVINKLKAWPGIATRYGKTPGSYLAGLHLRTSMIWIKELCFHHSLITPQCPPW